MANFLVDHEYTLEITPSARPQLVPVSEYDVGRIFTFTLKHNGEEMTIPSSYGAVTVEGTIGSYAFSEPASIENGKIVFQLTESMTAHAGKAWTKIKFANADAPISTCAFFLVVDRAGVEADTVIVAPGFEQQIQDAVDNYLEDHPVGVEVDSTLTISGAAADAKVTGDEITRLQTEVDDLKEGTSEDINEASLWESGTIRTGSGTVESSSTRIRTKFLPLSQIHQIEVESGFSFFLCAYFSSGTYVGFWNGQNFTKTGNVVWYSDSLSIPADGYQYKIVLRKDGNANISTDSYTAVKIVKDSGFHVGYLENVNSSSLWTLGAINTNSGTDVSATNRLRTSEIDSDVSHISVSQGYSVILLAYNQGTYLGFWNGQQFIKTGSATWYSGSLGIPYGGLDYRLAIKADDDSVLTTDSYDVVQILRKTDNPNGNESLDVDASLSVVGAPADAKATGDEIAQIKSDIEDLKNRTPEDEGGDGGGETEIPNDISYWTLGTIDTSNGGEVSSTNRLRSSFIPSETGVIKIDDGYSILLLGYTQTGTYDGAWNGQAFTRSSTSTWFTGELAIPSDSYKYRIILKKNDNSTLTTANYSAVHFATESSTSPTEKTVYPVDYSDMAILGKSVNLSGQTADISNLVDNSNFCCVIVPCSEGNKFRVLANGGTNSRAWGFINSSNGIISVAASESGTDYHTPLSFVDLTAPNGAAYLVVNSDYETIGATPLVWKLADDDAVNTALEESGLVPCEARPAWKRKVVATYKSMIVVMDNKKFKLSRNNGVSFDNEVDISAITDVTKAYHLFASGALAFFTQKKAYYITSAWSGYAEASAYEADGTTAYVPAALENFYTYQDYSSRKFVNGIDWYVFGNYIVNGGSSTRKLIWCTMDEGKTYRIIYEFGSNMAYNCRHVHFVQYYEPDDVYIVGTGDGSSEDHVFALRYANSAWTLTELGSGSDYKWASLDIWQDELYYTYDYTPGKLMMCKYADIGDFSKHQVIFDKVPNDAISFKIGPRGDGVLTMSWWRSGTPLPNSLPQTVCCRSVFYTPDRKNFRQIFIPPQVAHGYTTFSGLMDVTPNGHLIVGAHKANTTYWDKLPSLFLDEYIRKAGFPNALRPAYALNGKLD